MSLTHKQLKIYSSITQIQISPWEKIVVWISVTTKNIHLLVSISSSVWVFREHLAKCFHSCFNNRIRHFNYGTNKKQMGKKEVLSDCHYQVQLIAQHSTTQRIRLPLPSITYYNFIEARIPNGIQSVGFVNLYNNEWKLFHKWKSNERWICQ